jgi:hypothetical protein
MLKPMIPTSKLQERSAAALRLHPADALEDNVAGMMPGIVRGASQDDDPAAGDEEESRRVDVGLVTAPSERAEDLGQEVCRPLASILEDDVRAQLMLPLKIWPQNPGSSVKGCTAGTSDSQGKMPNQADAFLKPRATRIFLVPSSFMLPAVKSADWPMR